MLAREGGNLGARVGLVTLDRDDDDNAPFDRGRAIRFALVMVGLLGGAAASAQSPLADGQPLAVVLAADRDFAALAQETDLRAAFGRYLASDAVLLRPLPEPGRAWLASHEVASGKYEWSPAGAVVSCDGSLAVTVGRWQYVPPQTRTLTTGEYLTAWRRNPEGDWQIVLDEAVDIEPLDRIAQDIQARTTGVCQRSSASKRKLDALERRANGAMRSAGSAGTTSMTGRRIGTIAGEATSDLVVTYGAVAERGGRAEPGSARAVYVRIWQKTRSDWTSVLEVVTPVDR